MKKGIIVLITVLIAITAGLIVVYLNATKPLKTAAEKAIEIAQRETDLSNFSDFQLYNGDETYYVLKAKNNKNEKVYLWISEEDNKIVTKKVKSGVEKAEAVKTVYADREPVEIISVRLGITKIQQTSRAAWEVYYRTANDHLNYYYVDFETGEKLRAIDNF